MKGMRERTILDRELKKHNIVSTGCGVGKRVQEKLAGRDLRASLQVGRMGIVKRSRKSEATS